MDTLSANGIEIEYDVMGSPLSIRMAHLRLHRNLQLQQSDWSVLADTALTDEKAAEWRTYRQALRDLPSGLDTEEKVKAATFPTQPS